MFVEKIISAVLYEFYVDNDINNRKCVMASRIECDEGYQEVSQFLKRFKSKNDAKNYIVELVKKLNGGAENV